MAIIQEEVNGSSSMNGTTNDHNMNGNAAKYHFRKKKEMNGTATNMFQHNDHHRHRHHQQPRHRYTTALPLFHNVNNTIQIVLIIGVVVYIYVSLAVVFKLPITENTTSTTAASTTASGGASSQSKPKEPIVEKSPIEKLQEQFPVAVNQTDYDRDVEVILHPGKQFASKDLLYQQKIPLQWNMTVPRFWNPKQYYDVIKNDNATNTAARDVKRNNNDNSNNINYVRKYLGDYGNRLITKQEALSIGSHITIYDPELQKQLQLETIFIAIATYRDPECVTSINSIFLRAKYPQRIRVAIIDQRLPDNEAGEGEEIDPKCLTPIISCEEKPNQVLCQYGKNKKQQIDGMEIHSSLSIGPVFARHLGYRYYRGEYYAMQIDSHVRFVQDWDVDLIGQWKSAGNEMAVLSTYMSDLNGSIEPETHQSLRKMRPLLCDAIFEGEGPLKHLRLGQQPERPSAIQGQPLLHPFWAAGFSFARGHFLVQVPYDRYLPMIFQGEEIAIGVRGFTYGYDYYAPERSVVFHMYAVEANKERRDKVPKFWEHQGLYAQEAEIQSMKRLNGIIGMLPSNQGAAFSRVEEKEYGVGQVRPRELFFQLYGIHTQAQTREKHLCNFAGISMFKMFIRALRENGMGIDFSRVDYRFTNIYGD